MRLSADLIQESLSYLNPLNDRELDLRGHKIPAIENLGVAKDLSDTIDLTDNDISVLGNFPLSPRLRCLLLARNRITSIQSTLARTIPNLETLVLSENNIAELADLDVLSDFPRLTHLALLDNPVTRKQHYRHWIIWRCASLRFLDFQKVKQTDRTKASELFGTAKSPTALASTILGIKSRTFDPGSSLADASRSVGSDRASRVKLTDAERKKVEKMIRNAKSLQEIGRLEKDLAEGRVPAGIELVED